jgi:hypothetical protein
MGDGADTGVNKAGVGIGADNGAEAGVEVDTGAEVGLATGGHSAGYGAEARGTGRAWRCGQDECMGGYGCGCKWDNDNGAVLPRRLAWLLPARRDARSGVVLCPIASHVSFPSPPEAHSPWREVQGGDASSAP